MTQVRATALKLMALGYDVVPLRPRDKRPVDVNWPALVYTETDIDAAFPQGKPYNIGLKLGVEIADRSYPVAFDIDCENQDFARRVRFAIGPGAPRKRGNKGQTIIARTARPLKSLTSPLRPHAFKKVYGKTELDTRIELLGDGFQTVLPPSIHPITKQSYTWLTDHEGFPASWASPPLDEVRPEELPLIDEFTIEEIIAAAERPTLKYFQLNSMEWLGPEAGGNVHDVMVSSTASLVAEGWTDGAIERRVGMTVRFCLDRAAPAIRKLWNMSEFRRDFDAALKGARDKQFEQKTRAKVPKDRQIADAIVAQLGGTDNLWADGGGQLRTYRDGHWPVFSEHRLRNMIAMQYPDASNGNVMQATNLIVAALAPERTTTPELKVCLRNGTYDLASGELEEWSRSDNLINQMPLEWSPGAQTAVYDQFIQRTFTNVDIEDRDRDLAIGCFEEFLGYTLVNSTRFQKMLILKGATNSGKSTLTEIIKAIHGVENVSAVDLTQISEPNQLAQMDGKMVNIAGETKITSAVDDSILKSVVAGDMVSVKRLYHDTVSKRISARLVVVGNAMFRTLDTSGAVERRLLILRCDNSLAKEEEDPFMVEKLKEELPGIFLRVAAGLRRLYDRRRFNQPSYTKLELMEFSDSSNPLRLWAQDRIEECQPRGLGEPPLPEKFTPVGDLYADYRVWCDAGGYKPLNINNFGQHMTQLGFPSHFKRMGKHLLRMRKVTLRDMGVSTRAMSY